MENEIIICIMCASVICALVLVVYSFFPEIIDVWLSTVQFSNIFLQFSVFPRQNTATHVFSDQRHSRDRLLLFIQFIALFLFMNAEYCANHVLAYGERIEEREREKEKIVIEFLHIYR